MPNFPDLIAHRGYADAYPENSLLAIQKAVEAGAKFVEFDVLLTKDKVPVLFHDRDLRRMCDVDGAIHDFELTELMQLPVYEPARFAKTFINNRMTTLASFVEYAKTCSEVTFFVEFKRQAIDQFGINDVLNNTLPLLDAIHAQVVIISYSLKTLVRVREISDFKIGAVFDKWQEHESSLIQQLKAEYWFTDIDQLPDAEQLDCPGRLAVYECVDPELAIAVSQRGVDMVETFQIKEMLKALGQPL